MIEDSELLGQILTAQVRESQSASRRVEENLELQASDARKAIVNILEELAEVAERSDSYSLHKLVGRLGSRYYTYYEPFYHETAEHKQKMEDIDNGIF